MEKRKENARYLNQCFTMMVLLNCIIVLFLAFTIVLTQYRVAAAQEAQQFIETLKVMPGLFTIKEEMKKKEKRKFYCGMYLKLFF